MKALASLAAALIAAPILASGGSASAQEAHIRWGDLDLSTAAGADVFDARIRSAARKMCRDIPVTGGRAACQTAVRDEAVRLLPGAARVDYARSRGSLVA